ncbi:COG3772 Phage-related lysozyme (muraminidase) [uncultured Caudovirales phage]|uniref:Endolysin n=1 Tax=uncultured Caudovirales phage TaxID=2100421 RepID=A0A6J7X153_9CAUD|nr:COG3772 Phage-related lysozyme (muraminidase) [uncultured Caudovirales phage]
MSMRIIKKGIDIIKKYEGFSKAPYLCPSGIPTIGYGSTFYADGKKVTIHDKPISEEDATQILIYVIDDFSKKVIKMLKKELNENQFNALISIAYNIGTGALSKSTLLKKININPDDKSIRDEFLKWNRGGGKVLNGLVKRRLEESELYFTI